MSANLAMQYRRCAVCGGEEFSNVFSQATHSIAGIGDIDYCHEINICNQCGFVMANPLLAEEKILMYYEYFSNYENHNSDGRPAHEVQSMARRQVDLLTHNFPEGFSGRVLDIGCSISYPLYLLKEQGWEVLGLDPSDWCVRRSKELYGVNVIKGFATPEVLAGCGTFDVVILSHVLEHLIHPVDVLRCVRKVLNKGGLVYIEVPDLMGHQRLPGYFTFEHVNYFTSVSLDNLIVKAGFKVEKLKLFDNSEYRSTYPVISAILQKSNESYDLVNDIAEARATIADYVGGVSHTISEWNRRIDHVVNSTAPGRLALWGAGIHTSQLMSDTELAAVPLKCIFDNDKKKTGQSINGIPVKAFPKDPLELKKEVDAILISSLASEDEIYRQLEYLLECGINIYKLYGEDFNFSQG